MYKKVKKFLGTNLDKRKENTHRVIQTCTDIYLEMMVVKQMDLRTQTLVRSCRARSQTKTTKNQIKVNASSTFNLKDCVHYFYVW